MHLKKVEKIKNKNAIHGREPKKVGQNGPVRSRKDAVTVAMLVNP
jgi:hypothetical protein